MIQVNRVTKYFDEFRVLDEISMHVRRGTIYGLIGPNGAGKTTIINHINGVLTPKSGEITVGGEPVFENETIKSKVLNISDDWFYYSTYTIADMARFYRSIYPNFSTERYETIKGLFGLDEKRQIRKLSKGMKKQVAFWLSLSAMPEVLILDEFVGLLFLIVGVFGKIVMNTVGLDFISFGLLSVFVGFCGYNDKSDRSHVVL